MNKIGFTLVLLCCQMMAMAQELWVSPTGDDTAKGTQQQPLRSIQTALDRGGKTIWLYGGTYVLDRPIEIKPSHSGTKRKPLSIKSVYDEEVTISGGEYDPMQMIQSPEGLHRILNMDPVRQTITIEDRDDWKEANAMVVHQQWGMAILRITHMRRYDDSLVVSFEQPEATIEFKHPYPQPIINGEMGNSSYMLVKLTPQKNISELLKINADHVVIEGINFKRAAWKRPFEAGHVALQGGFPIHDAYLLDRPGTPWSETLNNQAWIIRPEAAVSMENAHHVTINNCMYENIADNALDVRKGCQDIRIENNEFYNIGGTAIMAGWFQEGTVETHVPYTAEDTTEYCSHILIKNNRISHATELDWGAAGIQCGYVRHTTIANNHITYVGWSGICLGWGWTPARTMMEDNHILNNTIMQFGVQHHDCGGIYTLSNQPGSSIEGNRVLMPGWAPFATNNRVFPLYLDESSDGFIIRKNKFYQKQIGFNKPGRNIRYETN